MSIGERLKEARIKRHLSQGQVAEILNVHRTTISKYEKNECEPTLTNFIKMIDLYCADANYILYGNIPDEIRLRINNVILSRKIYTIINEFHKNHKL